MKQTMEWIQLDMRPWQSPCLVTDGVKVEKAKWDKSTKQWVFPDAKLRIVPTHWMPLPIPPVPDFSSHRFH